jgi:solute:Na+ symporter, SSS family
LLYIPVSFVFFAIGTALFSYYRNFPGLLPQNMGADSVFPYYIIREMPVGLTGLLISAVFAAGMSTISTSVNSSATIILHDYSGIGKEPAGKEKQSMKILYLASFLFSLAGIGVALSMINVKSALDAWWKLASVFSGGMLGLFLLGYFAPRIKSAAAATGVTAGVLVIAWLSLSPFLFKTAFLSNYASTFHPYLSIVFGTMAIFMVGFLTGLLIRKVKNNKSNFKIEKA